MTNNNPLALNHYQRIAADTNSPITLNDYQRRHLRRNGLLAEAHVEWQHPEGEFSLLADSGPWQRKRVLTNGTRPIARHPQAAPLTVVVTEAPKARERPCRYCSKSFAPTDVRHRYCSPPCVTKSRKKQDERNG